MRIFIDNIEVDNYAFIKEVYEDRIVLDKELFIPSYHKCSFLHSFPRVYDNIDTISITSINKDTVYLDNEVNWHVNRRKKDGPLGIYVSHGALVTPGIVPEAVRRVLYRLFRDNKLRVAKRAYADWQRSVTFPENREFELAWRVENRLGTHNPDFIEEGEMNLDSCSFCSENYYKGSCRCKYYCGEGKTLLRKRIIETSM